MKRAPRVGLRGGRWARYSLAERLEARTIKHPSGCWEAQGYAVPNGYVQMQRGGAGNGAVYCHRVAYELAYGPIPEGLVVMHRCDNPRCVNPKHPTTGTQAENMRDALRKGRWIPFGHGKQRKPPAFNSSSQQIGERP